MNGSLQQFTSKNIECEFKEINKLNSWGSFFEWLQNKASVKNRELNITIARGIENRWKNRYRDINPFDETRVKINHDDIGDYINANYVQTFKVPARKYILTQGPLQNTAHHFWEMVWEHQSKGIIMLNRIIEKGTIKCFLYFPNESETIYFDSINLSILCISKIQQKNYILREMVLTNTKTDATHKVLHFNFTHWPDFGVPTSASSMLNFLWDVRSYGVLDDPKKPCIIHCSAGVGRSGTFILIDLALVLVDASNSMETLNLSEILLELRQCRMGIIQTPQQLRYSYHAVMEGGYALMSTSPNDRFALKFVDEIEHPDSHYLNEANRDNREEINSKEYTESDEEEADDGEEEEEEEEDSDFEVYHNTRRLISDKQLKDYPTMSMCFENSDCSASCDEIADNDDKDTDENSDINELLNSHEVRNRSALLHVTTTDISTKKSVPDKSSTNYAKDTNFHNYISDECDDKESRSDVNPDMARNSQSSDEESSSSSENEVIAAMTSVQKRREARLARQERTRAKLAEITARIKELDLARKRWLPAYITRPLQRFFISSGYINNSLQAGVVSFTALILCFALGLVYYFN